MRPLPESLASPAQTLEEAARRELEWNVYETRCWRDAVDHRGLDFSSLPLEMQMAFMADAAKEANPT